MVSNAPAGAPRHSAKVTDTPPSKAELARIGETPLYDADGKAHPFQSLYLDPSNPARHTMVIFVRHFLCGVRLRLPPFPCLTPR